MMPEAPFDPLQHRRGEDDVETSEAPPASQPPPRTRTAVRIQQRGTTDPFFGFLIAAGLSIGLTPLLPESVEFRYALAWGALAGVSVLSWLLGNMERINQENPDDIGWGILFGGLLGILCLVFLNDAVLAPAADRLFPAMSPGSLLAFLVFVMPLAETLFFRGLLQGQLAFWIVGLLATLWNILLFFPVMWEAVTVLPAVSAVIIVLLLMMNWLYVYVRARKGLAAAWMCQIVANLIIFYVPSL
ncbi:MAG: hypothetical protein OXG92_08775 [Chloroflexi bacterium]|nr:hypothetical protein [Chloroflexota bacterium]MCY3581998.1 hypothetical protein [Chloroflexota bacterium]MCY3716543.1 hypothetical protein [Chloroflexota bacterium]MDE2651652.1 hypothetical protein [Chloroflexota bacterium]MXV92898.1 hypothetical protein [Chloroflexota bacterium]